MRILLFLPVFILASCAEPSASDLLTSTYDQELETLRAAFVKAAAEYGRDLSEVKVTVTAGRVLRDGGEPAAGVCERQSIRNVVIVDSATWPTLTAVQKRGLVFHELGHCMLDRGHREGKRSGNDCAASLMTASLPLQSCLILHRDEYDEELFTI